MLFMIFLCVVSIILTLYFIKEFVNEKNNYGKILLSGGIAVFILLDLAGIMGIVAKSFELWGNHW